MEYPNLIWNTINLHLTHNRVPFGVLRLSAAGIQSDSGDARTDTEIWGEANTLVLKREKQ